MAFGRGERMVSYRRQRSGDEDRPSQGAGMGRMLERNKKSDRRSALCRRIDKEMPLRGKLPEPNGSALQRRIADQRRACEAMEAGTIPRACRDLDDFELQKPDCRWPCAF